MSYVIKSMVMPTGWHYEQPTNKGTTKLQADSYDELVKFVEDWRAVNGIEVGNVQMDVDTYICTKYPLQCGRPIHAWNQAPMPKKGQNFVDKISQWMLVLTRRQGGVPLVYDEVAKKRAEICEACPHNTPYQNSCRPCMSSITQNGAILRKGRNAANAKGLHGCNILNQDNKTAVFLDVYGEGFDNNQLPEFCWAKKKG